MSTREVLRGEIIEATPTKVAISQNQRRAKNTIEGERRLNPSSKSLLRAERRAQRAMTPESAKILRVLGRVEMVFNGYDGFVPEIFAAEVRFLAEHSHTVKAVKLPERKPH